MDSWSESVVVVKARGTGLPDQRSVGVVCTGGTLCMKANADGALAPEEGYLAERMLTMLEFRRPEMPACTLYELLPLLDSSDMGPDDWRRIADTLERLYYEHDGFVVVMGTDTMAYAASALSFMLESLGKSVILTGSMLPLSDLFNDAHRNLIVSIVIAATLDVPEVCIFMDDQLMRGNRTVKSNSSGLDAFESPNFPALAKLETGIRFRPNLVAPQPKGRFRVHRQLETNVGVWRMVPGFDDEYIRMAVTHCVELKAVVLELNGTGNLSGKKASLLGALEQAVARGIVIVATSQCLRGSVNLSAYALGRNLEAIGVLSAYDMTTEAVVAKLAYLLSWPDMNRSLLKQYMGRSLRGEISEELVSDTLPQHAGSGEFQQWQMAAASKPEPGSARLQSLMRQPQAGYPGQGQEERRIALPNFRSASSAGSSASVLARIGQSPSDVARSGLQSVVTIPPGQPLSTSSSPAIPNAGPERSKPTEARNGLRSSSATAAIESAASLARAMEALNAAVSQQQGQGVVP